jgi:hypothetical protein
MVLLLECGRVVGYRLATTAIRVDNRVRTRLFRLLGDRGRRTRL